MMMPADCHFTIENVLWATVNKRRKPLKNIKNKQKKIVTPITNGTGSKLTDFSVIYSSDNITKIKVF